MWNLFLYSIDHCSMCYNCSILHLDSCVGEVCLDLFPSWFHWLFSLFSTSLLYGLNHCSYGLDTKERKRFYINALVTTHICSIMVFVSHVDMTFSLMVLPLFWDELLWWFIFFLLWTISGLCLWSLMIILATCDNCA
jgi:hypothetical protein